MPNWCYNTLKVKGKKSDRDAFASDMEKFCVENHDITNGQPPVFDLNFCVRMPAEMLDTISPTPLDLTEEQQNHTDSLIKRFGVANWYDWALSYWGTKWNTNGGHINETSRMTIYTFNTAWSPPENALDALSKKYPHLAFHNKYSIEGYPGTWKNVYVNGTNKFSTLSKT